MAPLLPTIDISSFLKDPNSPGAAEVVSEVQRACMTIGFFQIIGHGIPFTVQEAAFLGAKSFFQLPLEEKRKLDRQTVPGASMRGYELLKSQKQAIMGEVKGGDTKEGFYVGFDIPVDDPVIKRHPQVQGPNLWPEPSIMPYHVFKEPMERYHTALVGLIRHMFSIVAAGLESEFKDISAIFDEFHSNYPIALLSPKHYPPSDEANAIGTGPHTDFGTLTLLLQDGTPGLEVRQGDEWIPVPPVKDAYVVNVGDMMHKWTRGRYKSTIHRVVAQRGDTHRYSMPFFFNGNPAARLVPFDGARDGETIQSVEEHMIERLKMTMLKM